MGGSKKLFETKVVDNTANPTWNQYHKTSWNGKDKLSFQVQESNEVFDNQPIGTANFNCDLAVWFQIPFASGATEIPVLDKKGKPAGSLVVKIEVLKRPEPQPTKAGPCGGCCPVS